MYKYGLIIGILLCGSCYGQGVVGMEQVVDLPEDGTKWHVSVVGTGEQYNELIRWFESDDNLKSLRGQVHFHPISDKDGIQAYNVPGLPAVRLQDDKGKVLYEAWGENIPITSQGLYGAMARAIRPCPWDQPDPPDPVDSGGGPPRVDFVVDWRLLIIVAALVAGLAYRFYEGENR